MYNPANFREQRPEVWLEVVRNFPFATLVTPAGDELHLSHLPLVVEATATSAQEVKIFGHLARANSHCKALAAGLPSVAIFHGPHAYVSPSWYEAQPSVPTWNYVVVHLHGRPQTVDSTLAREILRKLVSQLESGRQEPWPGSLPEDFLHGELQAIVGFVLDVERVEAKLKLSQNKSEADRAGVRAGLEREADFRSAELARFMELHARRPV
jgi:transcriptional regulator